MAEPTYRVAQVDQADIEKASRRTGLDEWLDAPWGDEADKQQKLLSYLTSSKGA